MYRKSFKWLGMSMVLAISVACTVSSGLQEPAESFSGGIYALTSDPECAENPATKSISTGMKFSFSDKDDISIYPSSGTTHMVYRLVPDASDAKKATFNSTDFDLQNGKTYYAFYPDVVNTAGAAAVTVSFAGQAQSANNSATHLAAYDYQTAQASISDNSGVFQFVHKVTWLKMNISVADAATLCSVTVSADDGVANTAVFDLLEGSVTPSRQSADKLVLTLGGDAGIEVAAGGTATAFMTIPSGTYTNLTLTAVDTEGNRYVKVYAGEKTMEAGLYYNPTLQPEFTPFQLLTVFGAYSSTDSDTPVGDRVYDDDSDQMSYGTGSGYRTFKLADLETGSYAMFTVDADSFELGGTCTVSSDIDGTAGESSCEVVRMTDSCVWLEDKTDSVGYVFAIE